MGGNQKYLNQYKNQLVYTGFYKYQCNMNKNPFLNFKKVMHGEEMGEMDELSTRTAGKSAR